MTSHDLAHTPHGRVVCDVLRSSDLTRVLLGRLEECGLPDWVLSAGAVAQTVWNAAHDFEPRYGIGDIDIVYYDDRDLSAAAERSAAATVSRCVGDIGIRLDVKNQARVHRWYPGTFGTAIKPYTSLEDAISSWPTTATAVGVRQVGTDMHILAPFGLQDLTELVVRPNRVQVPQAVYQSKAGRWRSLWPNLQVHSWHDGVGQLGARALLAHS